MSMLYSEKIGNDTLLKFGDKIFGKNNNNQYIVEKLLGCGENGFVYLVRYINRLYALKMNKINSSIDYEIYIINKLNQPQEKHLGVLILDMDEYIHKGDLYSYYVMPYHEGCSIEEYLQDKSCNEYLTIFKKAIEYLSIIHSKGLIFGDMKPEHIIINKENKSVYFIDFGGATNFNEGVRQFTEIFDRGSWKVNNRRADSHYDLFSLSMVFIQLSLGKENFVKLYNQRLKVSKICDIIRNIKVLKYLFPILKSILLGRLNTTSDVLYRINNISEQYYIKKKFNKLIYFIFTSSLILFIVIVLIYINQY